HARPLARLTPEQQRKAWRKYLAGASTPHSAEAIRQVCDEVARTPVNTGMVRPVNGHAKAEAPSVIIAPPISWYGGKAQLAQRIVDLIPKHHCYVEVFFGSGAVFFRKPPSSVEIINDLNSEIIGLFRILRDEGQTQELQRLLKLTPYSREEHDWCRANPQTQDPVERARRFFVRCRQSFSGVIDEAWSHSLEENRATNMVTPIDALLQVSERLRHVQVENKDFRAILNTCDRAGVVVYCDPPYLHGRRRRKNAYTHTMTEADHADLLNIVGEFSRAKVILSGYHHPLYDQQLKRWSRFEIPVFEYATTPTAGVRHKGRRTECLWTNF
ncbi:MAG: DNA adenine methylase, partial [Phycisphaerae bacterium]